MSSNSLYKKVTYKGLTLRGKTADPKKGHNSLMLLTRKWEKKFSVSYQNEEEKNTDIFLMTKNLVFRNFYLMFSVLDIKK